MTIERPLLAVLATIAFGVSAAGAAVPAIEPSNSRVAADISASWLLLAANDDDLTWRFLHSTRRDPVDRAMSPDWTTRGDPGSQDSSFNSGQTGSPSSQQNDDVDDDDDDHPPCFC